MSGYTIKSLKEVEDAAVRFGLSPDLESRFAREDLGGDQIGLSYLHMAPGVRQPFAHRHGSHEEVYVVVEGSGQVRLDGETADIARWDAVRVAPETVRAFAAGPEGLTLLAIGPWGSGDAEMRPADW
jgi:mannose-6-phosphate isomerase-like protein (cupin superfamily)